MKKLFVLAFALAFTTAAFANETTTTMAPTAGAAAAAPAEKAPAAPAHAKKVKKAHKQSLIFTYEKGAALRPFFFAFSPRLTL